jgi:hypothetical protein
VGLNTLVMRGPWLIARARFAFSRPTKASRPDWMFLAMRPWDRRRGLVSKPDVLALSIGSALGRLAIGVGIFAVPRRALSALGFGEVGETGLTLARVAAARDVILAVATLLALEDRNRLRAASLANAAADGGDALSFALALGRAHRNPTARRGIAVTLPAAAAGLWVFWRLRD